MELLKFLLLLQIEGVELILRNSSGFSFRSRSNVMEGYSESINVTFYWWCESNTMDTQYGNGSNLTYYFICSYNANYL